tara:strand:- start:1378 stop:2022 length:645 start_codon:yes stop_codon:yes gene_type:complete
MTKLAIKYKKTDDLIPYANNSRLHDETQLGQLVASIQEFGFTNPVLLDGENGIIAGHGRVMAAQILGMNEIPTIELGHLTDEQKKAYVIADNKLALNGKWDAEVLALELQSLEEAGFALDITGFNDAEIGQLFSNDDDENDQTIATDEWKGMPEFTQNDATAKRTILVHFEDLEQVRNFSSLVDDSITDKTKFIWFPRKERADMSNVVYQNKDS